MDPSRPWLSSRAVSAYPGRLPVTGPLPVALPGLEIHHRDPRFIRQPHSSDDSDEFLLPTYEETWSDGNSNSDHLSRHSVPVESAPVTTSTTVHRRSVSVDSFPGPPFHPTTLPTLQPNDRQSALSNEANYVEHVPESVVQPAGQFRDGRCLTGGNSS